MGECGGLGNMGISVGNIIPPGGCMGECGGLGNMGRSVGNIIPPGGYMGEYAGLGNMGKICGGYHHPAAPGRCSRRTSCRPGRRCRRTCRPPPPGCRCRRSCRPGSGSCPGTAPEHIIIDDAPPPPPPSRQKFRGRQRVPETCENVRVGERRCGNAGCCWRRTSYSSSPHVVSGVHVRCA